MRAAIRTAALTLALALVASMVWSQERPRDPWTAQRDVATADTLFREGRALMKKGQYEAACPKLEESYRLDPAAGAGINLGDCFEKVGKVASALLAYRAARELLRSGDPRIGPVEQEIKALDARVPRLTLRIKAGAPTGTHVRRDGRKVTASQFGVPVPVNPGKHLVVVGAPDHEEARYALGLKEGDVRGLEVEPGHASVDGDRSNARRANPYTSPARRGEPSDEQKPRGSSQRTFGFVTGAVGLAGLTGAGAVEIMLWNDCDRDRKCKEDPRGTETAARLLWGIGALGVGVGGYLLLTDDADAPTAQTAIGPSVLRGGAALTIRKSF